MSESGLRFLNSGLGRFVSRDPASKFGGPDLYAFTGNNPVVRVDPRGLFPLEPIQPIVPLPLLPFPKHPPFEKVGPRKRGDTCCDRVVRNVWNSYGAQIFALMVDDCLDDIRCLKTCNPPGQPASNWGAYGQAVDGAWIVCLKTGRPGNEMRQTLIHELQHARDRCAGPTSANCAQRMTWEAKAHYCSGSDILQSSSSWQQFKYSCKPQCPTPNGQTWEQAYLSAAIAIWIQIQGTTCWWEPPPANQQTL